MRRIDELHLEHPFAGSRMLRDMLHREGIGVGRQHVATLMRTWHRSAFQEPEHQPPASAPVIYPDRLRKLVIVGRTRSGRQTSPTSRWPTASYTRSP